MMVMVSICETSANGLSQLEPFTGLGFSFVSGENTGASILRGFENRDHDHHRIFRLPLTLVLPGGRAPPEAERRTWSSIKNRVAEIPAPAGAGPDRALSRHVSGSGLEGNSGVDR